MSVSWLIWKILNLIRFMVELPSLLPFPIETFQAEPHPDNSCKPAYSPTDPNDNKNNFESPTAEKYAICRAAA
jgi:hypothetical protein